MPGGPAGTDPAGIPAPPEAAAGGPGALVAAEPAATALRAVAAHLALCTLDGEGRILAVNERFCALVGTERERLLGWGIDVLRMEHAGHPLLEAAGPALHAGRPWRGEVSLVGVDERPRWTDATLLPLGGDPGGPRQILLVQTDLTRQKDAETGLARLQGRLAQLLNDGPAVVYASPPDASRRLTYVSGNVRAILGHRPEAALAPGFWQHQVHPEDRACVLARLPALFRDGRLAVEYRFRGGDGRWLWVRDRMRLVRGPDGRPVEIAGALTDVTERRRAEDALRESERNLRTLAENAHDAILVLQDGRIAYANRAAHTLLGWPPGALRGAAPAELTMPDERRRLARLENAWREGAAAPARLEIVLRRREGGEVPVELSASRILWDGAPAVAVTARDIRMRRALERELRRARDEALAAERAKSALLANLSHEIRTPLAGVIGMLELLAGDGLPEGARRRVENARRAAEHLMHLLDDLLELSRLEAGALPVRPEPLDLARVLESVCRDFADAAARKRLRLDWRVAPELPRRVRADPIRLRQVLANLVGNAVKFTQQGGVEVEAVAEAEGRVRIEVRDTGPGIPPAEIERVFRPFAQGDVSAARRHGGTGLGLAIARQIVARMGGRLTVDSAVGQGSCFSVSLPLPAAGPPGEVPPLAGRRVVVACGEPFLQASLAGALAWLGAEVVGGAGAAAGEVDALVGDAAFPGRGASPRARRRIVVREPWEPAGAAGPHAALERPLVLDELAAAVLGRPARCATTPAPGPWRGRRPRHRVLVVEDDPVNREVAAGLLARLGCEVCLEAAAEDALARLERERFDLVLMDCQLPGLDGYEAVRRLRERERAFGQPPVRVVAMTAHAMEGDRERCLEAGMDGYLAKPVRVERLEGLLATVPGAHPEGDGAEVAPQGASPRPEVLAQEAAEAQEAEGAVLDARRLTDLRAALGPAFGRAVGAFLETLAARVAGVRAAAGEGDADALLRAAHTLKGAAANLGAETLAAACEAVVRAIREGRAEEAIELASRVPGLAEATQEALAAELDGEARVPPGGG